MKYDDMPVAADCPDTGQWEACRCRRCGGPARARHTNLRAVAATGDERCATLEIESVCLDLLYALGAMVEVHAWLEARAIQDEQKTVHHQALEALSAARAALKGANR